MSQESRRLHIWQKLPMSATNATPMQKSAWGSFARQTRVNLCEPALPLATLRPLGPFFHEA
eukprot:8660586-Pyramimonas_sp.AAC.1